MPQEPTPGKERIYIGSPTELVSERGLEHRSPDSQSRVQHVMQLTLEDFFLEDKNILERKI